MLTSGNKKDKDWVLFPYDGNDERALKLDFSGNIKLTNGNKGTILGVKASSKDGTKRFVRVFAQVGVIFKGDDKFTGDMNYPDAGGEKAIIGWLKQDKSILSGYSNEKQAAKETKQTSAF